LLHRFTDYLDVVGSTWQHTYDLAQQCRAYMLEERSLDLNGDVLRYVVNGDTGNAVNLVDGLINFQVQAIFSDSTVQDTLDATDDWGDLKSIEVTLTGQATAAGNPIQRTLSARFFPRNVLSL
jgi:hypothetical protein